MVAPLPPRVQEPRPQDHHRLARALLQLNLQRKFSSKNLTTFCHALTTKAHLNPVELLVDDEYHPVDLLGRDGPHPRLLPQKVHHVRRELLAALGGQFSRPTLGTKLGAKVGQVLGQTQY